MAFERGVCRGGVFEGEEKEGDLKIRNGSHLSSSPIFLLNAFPPPMMVCGKDTLKHFPMVDCYCLRKSSMCLGEIHH